MGLTTGACMAHLGHSVICADIDAKKIADLTNGIIPIVELGLSELVKEGISSGRLSFTYNVPLKRSPGFFLLKPSSLISPQFQLVPPKLLNVH